jgi:hypothetical protein
LRRPHSSSHPLCGGCLTRQSGDSVNAVVKFNLTSPSNVESVGIEFPSSGEATTCYNVEPDQISAGNNKYSQFDMELPTHPGTWDVIVRLYGANGNAVDQECNGAVLDQMTFNNVVVTTAVTSVPTYNPAPSQSPAPVGGPSSPWAALMA